MTLETNLPDSFSDAEDTEGFDAFLKNIQGGSEKPKEDPETPAAPEGAEEAPEGAEGAPEGSEAGEVPAEPEEDDAEIELKIGDDSRKVKMSDVKRLVETETTLTAKTAEAAKAAESALAENNRAQTALNRMLDRAKERFKPYEGLNLFVLSKQMDDATFVQLQADMQAAYADVQFYEQELGQLVSSGQQARAEASNKAAQEAMRVLQTTTDPRHIPGFSREVYSEMVDFAASVGLDRNAVLGITDPGAIKLIHMAMQHAKGSKAVAAQVVKPVVHKPTKTMRPGSATNTPAKTTGRQEAVDKLRRTGSEEAGIKAFLSTF